MRSTTRTYVATALLGSTLISAVPQRLDTRSLERAFEKRAPLDPGIGVTTGSAPPATPDPDLPQPSYVTADAAPSTSRSTTPAVIPQTTAPSQTYDNASNLSTNLPPITTTTGSRPNPAGATASSSTLLPVSDASSQASRSSSLAPQPTVEPSGGLSSHGALTGVVVGGLVLGFLLLTLGLWFCYRRRGVRSGLSTPIYTTKVVTGDKPGGIFGFLRGRSKQWKGHHRVQSSMSFSSPMVGNEPKMMEQAYSPTPLAPHLGGSSAGGASARDTTRWSTFSTSDGSAYPQTPVGTTRLSGIIMETVVETDAISNPRTPSIATRSPLDYTNYTNIHRSSHDAVLTRTPKKTSLISQLPPLGTNRLSMFREEESASPTTTSSRDMTFGSIGHGSGSNYARTIDRNSQQPLMTTHANGSGSLRSGPGATALVHSLPKFNPAHSNGSSSLSTDSEGTIRITNPFLDDEDNASSYSHGIVDADDSRSIQTMDSDVYGAYPSSNGCIPKPGPSPGPGGPLAARPRSSLISDTSSDYPYPLGYAVDSDGNVANPFLRISEILEEVDGRMRWPSPPLLSRAESRNY